MVDDQGRPLADAQLLDRIAEIGALVVRRGAVDSHDFVTWRRDLRRAATSRGFRLHIRQAGDDMLVVSNPDHVVDPAHLRAAIHTLPSASDLGPR